MATTSSTTKSDRGELALGALGVAAFATIIVGAALAHYQAPVEGTLGIVQKIFYFHVPSAITSYVGFAMCAVGSIIYLLKPLRWADRLARAGAEVGVLMACLLLTSGPLWGYKSWGTYWEWEPRLTSMLLTFLIYVSYLLLRQFGGTGESSRRIGAVMGVLGMVGVGIVRVSVRLWGGVHPQVMTGEGAGIHPSMEPAFYTCFLGFFLLVVFLIALRMRIAAQSEAIEELHLRAGDLEYELEAR